MSISNRPDNDPMTLKQRASLRKDGRIDGEAEGVDHRFPTSTLRQDAKNSALVSGFEDQMFKSQSVADVKGVVNNIRNSLIEGGLSSNEITVLSKLLVRGEAKSLALAGIDPDAHEHGYLDRASTDSRSHLEPTEAQLAEVDAINQVHDAENAAQRYRIDMSLPGLDFRKVETHIRAYLDDGTELPTEEALFMEQSKATEFA